MNHSFNITKIITMLPFCLLSPALFGQESQGLKQALIQASSELRQVIVASKADTYRQTRASATGNRSMTAADLSKLQADPTLNILQKRLGQIWLERNTHPKRFETVSPYAKAANLDPTQVLILAGRQAPDQRRRINLPRFSLALLHPDLVAATQAHPDIYQAALEMGEDIRQRAEALVKEKGRDNQGLAQEYEKRMQALFDLAEDNPEMTKTIRDIVSAAQPPSYGATYPVPPRLNPDYLLAWEELTMQTPDLELKLKLVQLICEIDPISTMPCLGLVLEQTAAGWKAGNQSVTLNDMATIILNHFRDFPSQSAAIALSNAIAFAQSGPNPVRIPLGTQLDSPHWQMVLRSLGSFPDGKPHVERLQNAKQPPM